MLILRRIAALFFVLLVSLGFDFSTADDITTDGAKPTTERTYCFDDDRLLIGGYNFDIGNADDTHVSYVREAGIDFLITRADENLLDLCDKYGVGVIASGYNAPALYYNGNTASWYNIARGTYRDHPALWGDDLIDEPTAAMFEELGKVTDHYYANTTGKLPLINLFPNYANEEQLGETSFRTMKNRYLEAAMFDPSFLSLDKNEFAFYGPLAPYYARTMDYIGEANCRYVRHIQDYINNIDTDYISVDIYPLGWEGKTSESWLRNLDILAQACRKTNKNLWVITQAAGSVDNDKRYCNSVKDIRWQMYTSMAFGAKAIIHACYNGGWWDTDSHLIDASGNRTETYYAAKQADSEVAPFAKLYGEYKYFGTFMKNPYFAAGTDSGYLSAMDEAPMCEIDSFKPILVGCFKNEDGRAYTIVNMSETGDENTAKLVAEFDGASSITVFRKGVKTEISGSKLDITLENQEGIYITVK